MKKVQILRNFIAVFVAAMIAAVLIMLRNGSLSLREVLMAAGIVIVVDAVFFGIIYIANRKSE